MRGDTGWPGLRQSWYADSRSGPCGVCPVFTVDAGCQRNRLANRKPSLVNESPSACVCRGKRATVPAWGGNRVGKCGFTDRKVNSCRTRPIIPSFGGVSGAAFSDRSSGGHKRCGPSQVDRSARSSGCGLQGQVLIPISKLNTVSRVHTASLDTSAPAIST
jgi:hypothetical protein